MQTIQNVVLWLKSWFYDEDEIDTLLSAKLNANLTTANANVVTDGSGNVTTEAKPVIPDVTGKADKSGGVQQVTDANAHSNIGTSANATQGAINTAIDSVIGSLSSIQAIQVVSSLPTASSSTMGKLYIVSENSKINVYYTEQSSSSYSWHKMDTDILDELSIAWSDITGKPSSFTPSSHTHEADEVNDEDYQTYTNLINIGSLSGGLQYLINQAIDTAIGSHDASLISMDTAISGKAPKSHSSSATTYGVGTTSNYGHNKIRDNLTASTLTDGESLSAHQGYVLNQAIQGKQDVGDCITSIALVPKSSDSSGAIRLYYGDEP